MPRSVLQTGGCGDETDAVSSVFLALVFVIVGAPTLAGALISIDRGYAHKDAIGRALLVFIIAWPVLWFVAEYFLVEPCRTAERKARAIARRSKAAIEIVNPPAPTQDAVSKSK